MRHNYPQCNIQAAAFFLLSVLFASGCMQTDVPTPQKQPLVGLSGAIKAELSSRHQKIAALAASCSSLPFEDGKKKWNTEYHNILTESTGKITSSVKILSDAATTPDTQQALWLELKKAYE